VNLASKFTIYALLFIFLAYSIFPLYIAVSASLKDRRELFRDPLGLPDRLHFENYAKAFNSTNLKRAYINSSILVLGTIAGVLVTAIPAAYALAKINFRFNSLLIGYFFFCTTIPAQLSIIPLYFMFSKLHLTNSFFGLILLYIASFTPFSILLMRSYFVSIPNELLEAALIDGASTWQAFWKIIFPVARPGVITTVVIVAMWSWNNFILPLTFINKPNLTPVTVAIAMLRGKWSAAWEVIMAASILGALPIGILFAILHRRFIAGLAGTGLKG